MFQITTLQGKPWVSADVLAEALEFSSTKALLNLYRSNRNEFTENDVFVDEQGFSTDSMQNPGRPRKLHYFSEDGAVLICMFARTDKAKEVRKLIREVFMNWYRGQKAAWALPATQPELFPEAKPSPKTPQAEVKIDQRRGVVTLKLPVSELHRLGALSNEVGLAAPLSTPQGDEPPDAPVLRYDFAKMCQEMHGWYTAARIAEVVGCTKETVHIRCRLDRLPAGWSWRRKQNKVWVYIP